MMYKHLTDNVVLREKGTELWTAVSSLLALQRNILHPYHQTPRVYKRNSGAALVVMIIHGLDPRVCPTPAGQ